MSTPFSNAGAIRGHRSDRRRSPVGHSVNARRLADHLFPDPQARRVIGMDPNYRDGVAVAARQLSHVPAQRRDAALIDLGWDHTFTLLQPDAFARRLVPQIIDIIRENGFEPVSSRVVNFTETMVGELWRYQATTESENRINIINPYMTTSPSLA